MHRLTSAIGSIRGTPGSGALPLLLARICGYLLLVLASLAVARSLGPSKYGLLATATAIVGILFTLGSVGLDQLFLRKELGNSQFRRYVASVSCISIIVVAVAAALWPNLAPTTRRILVLCGSASALGLLTQPWLLTPQRALLFALRARREIALRVLTASSVIVVAATTRSPLWVAVALLLATAVPSGLVTLRPSPKEAVVSTLDLRRALGKGIVYASSGALYALYVEVDVALVAILIGSTQAGYYNIATGFLTAAATLPIVLNNDVLRTRLYQYRNVSDRGYATSLIRRFLLITLVVGALGSVMLLLFAHPIIALLFGSAYTHHVVPLLEILALAVLPHYFNNWAANVLIAGDDVRVVLVVQAALTAFNVVSNVVLLPHYGVAAAAWITVVTEGIGSMLYVALTARRGHRVRRAVS